MPTSFPMSTPHAPTGFVTQAALDAAFTVPINDAAALALSASADTGVQTSGGMSPVAASGWSLTSYSWRLIGNRMEVTFVASRTGAAITAGASGNFADTAVLNISGTGFVPVITQYGCYIDTTSGNHGSCLLSPSVWQVLDGYPSQSIATSDSVRATFSYSV